MKDKRTKRIEFAFALLSVLILVATLAVAIIWVLQPDQIKLEPILVLLGALYTLLPILGGWAIRKLNSSLKRERFTLPYALAYGYVYNYLAPVVRRLRKESNAPENIRFYVYIPAYLGEFHRNAIDEILAELRNRKYEVQPIKIVDPLREREWDARTAKKLADDDSGITKYFDFPTTLLTLERAVEYKLDTRSDSFQDKQKDECGREYIEDFRDQLMSILSLREFDAIRQNIFVVQNRYRFLEAE